MILTRFLNQTLMSHCRAHVMGQIRIADRRPFNRHGQQFYVRIPNFDGVGDSCLLVHANESRQSAPRVLSLVMRQVEVSTC